MKRVIPALLLALLASIFSTASADEPKFRCKLLDHERGLVLDQSEFHLWNSGTSLSYGDVWAGAYLEHETLYLRMEFGDRMVDREYRGAYSTEMDYAISLESREYAEGGVTFRCAYSE